MWRGGAQRGSLSLCYAGPLAEKQKSGIFFLSGVDRSRFLGRGAVGKLGEEEEEPATKRRREYTDLGLDLGEREEQIVCHVSALALAMTDEARREAEM